MLVPEVGEDLRTPCLVADREYETLTDVGLILTDYVEGLGCANTKIEAIDVILTDAEARAVVQR